MICVLDHGSVAGLGTHDELYATCQLYREICQSQLRRRGARGPAGECGAHVRPKSASRPGCPGIHLRKGGLLNESVHFLGSVATMTANVSGNDNLNDLGDGPRQPTIPSAIPWVR